MYIKFIRQDSGVVGPWRSGPGTAAQGTYNLEERSWNTDPQSGGDDKSWGENNEFAINNMAYMMGVVTMFPYNWNEFTLNWYDGRWYTVELEFGEARNSTTLTVYYGKSKPQYSGYWRDWGKYELTINTAKLAAEWFEAHLGKVEQVQANVCPEVVDLDQVIIKANEQFTSASRVLDAAIKNMRAAQKNNGNILTGFQGLRGIGMIDEERLRMAEANLECRVPQLDDELFYDD